jgi:hypothetical protein
MRIQKNKRGGDIMEFGEKQVTISMIIITALWIVVVVLGATGLGFVSIYFALALLAVHFFVGLRQDDRINRKFILYPFASWLILYIIAFVGMRHYAVLFADSYPTFSIMGMHPSFFFMVGPYWLGGVLTVMVGLYALRKEWLSSERWEAYLEKIKQLDKDEKKESTR